VKKNLPHQGSGSAIGDREEEHQLSRLVTQLFHSDLAWLHRGLMKILRIRWRGRSIRAENEQKEEAPLPGGPFATTRKKQLGDLLLWVPRRIDSFLINDLTGGYGYSHATIDTGEIDLPTRKPVMAEITIGQTVSRKFQDEYRQRPFARVPLAQSGLDVEQFVSCVKGKLGEQYDGLEAITLGEIDDPAKEVCSGLAADCLPESARKRIARARRMGLLHRASVSVYSGAEAAHTREFISPNGFAEFYGAPKGKTLPGPDTLVTPRLVDDSTQRIASAAVRQPVWKLGLGLAVAGLLFLGVLGFDPWRRNRRGSNPN
jgi:hypothetical protein